VVTPCGGDSSTPASSAASAVAVPDESVEIDAKLGV
jgi:hypothetical protein